MSIQKLSECWKQHQPMTNSFLYSCGFVMLLSLFLFQVSILNQLNLSTYKRIGKHSDPILVGNLSKSSRIPTRSHQDLEAPFHNMITSRSTSSPGILFSTSPGEMSLLPLTPSSVTHQPLMMAQFFIGRDTLVCDAYGIKTQKQFKNTLYDNIRFRGAMTTLITDGGRYVTEFRQPLQVQSHLEMPGILVQLGHIQRT